MAEKMWPLVHPLLLAHLKEAYPDKCPDPTKLSVIEIAAHFGEQRLIRKLEEVASKQKGNSLVSV